MTMKQYSRVEIIDMDGRSLVHYGKVVAQEQDNGKTLKVFLEMPE